MVESANIGFATDFSTKTHARKAVHQKRPAKMQGGLSKTMSIFILIDVFGLFNFLE